MHTLTKLTLPLFLALSFSPTVAAQQTKPKVVLNYVDTVNPPTTTYNILRAPGECTGTPPFAKIISGVTLKTYTDATVDIGNYCYAVTASFSGKESTNSNTAGVSIQPVPPILGPITFAFVKVPPTDEIIQAIFDITGAGTELIVKTC